MLPINMFFPGMTDGFADMVGNAAKNTFMNPGSGNGTGDYELDSLQRQQQETAKRIQERQERLMRESQRMGQTPTTGVNDALAGINNPGSALNPNSPFNQGHMNNFKGFIDDEEQRAYRMAGQVVKNQKDMEGFRNQYNAAENMLNRYLDMSRSGMNNIASVMGQRY